MASKLKSFQIMLIFILPMMLEFEDVLSEAHNWQTKTRQAHSFTSILMMAGHSPTYPLEADR